MRTLALISLIAIGQVASASFDLMLLGDNTTAGSERVMRYDPVNRVTLGYFGQGFINAAITDIAVDQVGGKAFVLQANGGVRIFNYNTGALLDTFTTSSLYTDINYDASLNRISVGAGSGSGTSPARAYDATSLSIAALMTGYYGATGVLRRSGANWYASFGLDSTTSNVVIARHALTGGAPLETPTTIMSWTNGNAPRHAILGSDGQLIGVNSDSVANTSKVFWVNTTAAGYTGTVSSTLVSTYAVNTDIANAHGPFAYILNGTSLMTYHTVANQVVGTQTLSGTYRGMAVVIAPEPGTMLALGAGIAALLRRRQKAAS